MSVYLGSFKGYSSLNCTVGEVLEKVLQDRVVRQLAEVHDGSTTPDENADDRQGHEDDQEGSLKHSSGSKIAQID